MTLLVANGTVVSSTGAAPADVLIDGETVVAVLQPGSQLAQSAARGADRVIDATGLLVVPGGVDAHTHMELTVGSAVAPGGSVVSSDDFETGTRAAAWGGTTTIVDFVTQHAGERVRDCVEDRFAAADGRCAVDYGFHQILGGIDDESLREMDALVDEGISSFKLFMAYPGRLYSDDGRLLRAMQQAAGNGGLIMMHAENGLAIDVLAAQAVERGETSPAAHGRVRRAELEGEAVHRAVQLAAVGAAPLYIVHLSCSEALEQVVIARNNGANVFAETCPQYLYLTLEDTLARPGFEGARWVCSPPIRTGHAHHHADLWRGLRTNDLCVVATDHCPFCMVDQKDLGVDDFRAIPNGLGSVEHRMDLLYQGVAAGEIGLGRWVELCSTTPARMFGLYPRKGVIRPGSDADIVLYDPDHRWTISVDTHHMNVDYSAYEGIEVAGRVHTVVSRGRVIVEGERFVGSSGHGRFLRRGLSQYLI